MDQGPLVNDQIEAGARFLAEFQKCYPGQSAFWLRDRDEGTAYLYIASEQITDANFHIAYRKVGRVARALQDPWFDVFKVKVINTDHRLAKAAHELRQRYPIRRPTRFPSQTFGGVDAEELWLYPSPIPAAVSQGG